MVKRAVTPRLGAQEMRGFLAIGEPCGVVFGPERTGLVNDDITLADTVLNVPLNPAFSSLNLAQAVLIVGYEWFIASQEPPPETLHTGHSRPATKEELVRFFDHFEEALVDSGFIRHPDKRPSLFRNLRNLFQRANRPSRNCARCTASSPPSWGRAQARRRSAVAPPREPTQQQRKPEYNPRHARPLSLLLSPFARKVRIVLAEKNLDFTMKVEKVWERRPEFLALNPAGEVPVLIEPDGTVLADADAIAEYLDETYRDKLLIGLNPLDRAEVRRLVAWFDVKMNREVTDNLRRREDDEALSRRRAARTRRRSAPARPICPITSTISAISPSGGAGSPAIISRSPTSPPRRISRRSTISATCRGTSTSRPRNGTRASSRGRASARSWPTTCPARRRRSTTPISISEPG